MTPSREMTMRLGPNLVTRHPPLSAKDFTFFRLILRFDCGCKMKAVILAAGKGTRMRDLTNELPKPMLKVHGKPILEHIIHGLLTAGVREIFIVTGFKAEVIEEYF